MRRVLTVLVVSFLALACEQGDPTSSLTAPPPGEEISDWAHGGSVEGFYFLPPMVEDPITAGTFNPLVAPLVRICRLDEAADPSCTETVAEYTLTSGTDGATLSVSTADEHYRVNWNTQNFELDPESVYRIAVYLTEHDGALRLGYADVEVGSNMGELRNVDTESSIPLVDSRTLPIKFRIEEGAGCEGDLDCGEGTVDDDGGVVTTASGAAGVSVPAGAVSEPVTITIRQLDPAQQPGETCLPTGIRQDGACYEFDTEEELSGGTFDADVLVGVCPSPEALREDRLTLHKYDPEKPAEGVVELEGAEETFLRCDEVSGPGYVAAGESLLGRLADVAGRLASPLGKLLLPEPLLARDAGRAGLTDSFSRVSWAESIVLASDGVPGSATPEASLTTTIDATTAHNGELQPTAGTDARLRFDYTDPEGTESVWHETTDGQGEVLLDWPLTAATGVHTLLVSSRGVDPSLAGDPVIDDPTQPITLQVMVCDTNRDCGLGVIDDNGGTVTTADQAAGVSFPADAVTSPVTVTIEQLDPAEQPGGRCLPTGLRQDGACYDFDTVEEIADVTGGMSTFLEDVTVGVCPNPNPVRENRLTLHKYNPERPQQGVVELPNAQETFLDCSNLSGPGYALANPGWLDRLGVALDRTLGPVASLLGPAELHARDAGRGGLTDSFSRISWAESIVIDASGAPTAALPGELVTVSVDAATLHNYDTNGTAINPTDATDAQLRLEYTDPSGSQQVWFETTDAFGAIDHSWNLTQVSGTHTLEITTRDHDPDLQGSPLIPDPTTPATASIDVIALVQDQVSDTTTGTSLGMPVGVTDALYQSFTPDSSSLAAAQLRLRPGGDFPSSGYTSTVHLRAGAVDGPVIATASEFIPGSAGTASAVEVTHLFASLPALTPGNIYVIEWVAPESAILTWYVSAADHYPDGTAFDRFGDVRSGEDFMFITFAPAP